MLELYYGEYEVRKSKNLCDMTIYTKQKKTTTIITKRNRKKKFQLYCDQYAVICSTQM